MTRDGVKIVDLQNTQLPDTTMAFNQGIAISNGSRHHNQIAGHSTVFKMKPGGYGGGFFKPKTPGEAYFMEPSTYVQGNQAQQYYFQSNQTAASLATGVITTTNGGGIGTKSPNPSEKGINK